MHSLVTFILVFNIVFEYASSGNMVAAMCPFGWMRFGNSCYYFHRDVTLTWQEASSYCRSRGGHLAIVDDGNEKDFIYGIIMNMPGEYWLDGVDDHAEGLWEWAFTGTKIVNKFWYPGEPNQATEAEDCMETSHFYNGLWNDEECFYKQYSICEKPYH